mgnify:FL=1
MANKAKLPIGIENFEEIRKEEFYYVDKTGLIKELLNSRGKVNLFTRPRRFGKSLNMDMLKCFFECGCDAALFEGLNISREKEYCEKYMGSFPVVSVSLKGVSGTDYAMALGMLRFAIGNEALRFQFLSESPRLSDRERAQYRQLINVDTSGRHGFLMTEEVLANSLYTLCACLHKHYGRKTILLIDEYDVPLDKAQQAGYYDDMVSLIRNMFGQALKTNASLHMAVLTGCLRITKESIFTGLNNMNIFSVTDPRFSQWFGFTAGEIREMLDYYGFADKSEDIREWYNGYRFGSTDIYCPWDVINYVSLLLADPLAKPQAFWINTSGNDIIRRFISMATGSTRREIERLVDGESVAKPVNQNLTYRDLYKNIGNLWSVLFATGYLTQRGEKEDGALQLAIPNREIRQIFAEQILDWFQEEARRDTPRLDAFCDSFPRGDAHTAEELFGAYLARTISVRDAGGRKGRRESFYHGVLLGLLSHREDWVLSSNAEAGEGYSDILAEDEAGTMGIVIEVKYAEDGDLEKACLEALEQIDRKGYAEGLRRNGVENILKYGIACYKKRCRILLKDDGQS